MSVRVANLEYICQAMAYGAICNSSNYHGNAYIVNNSEWCSGVIYLNTCALLDVSLSDIFCCFSK